MSVLHNAVDLERVNSNFSPADAKHRLGISGDSFVVGIAARLECIKRHDLFIATAGYLAERIPTSKFVIAGAGRQKESLQRLISKPACRVVCFCLGTAMTLMTCCAQWMFCSFAPTMKVYQWSCWKP